MQELIPSASLVYAVSSLLLVTLVTAGVSLYFSLRDRAASEHPFFWLKIILSAPLALLGAGLMAYSSGAFGVLFLVSGSSDQLQLLFLTLAPIVAYVIALRVLVRWIRNKRSADIIVIVTIVSAMSLMFLFQRPWLCWSLAHIGIGSEQNCTTRHERDLDAVLKKR